MHMVYLPQKGGDKHVYTTTRKKMNETIAEALGALEGQITPAPEKIPAGMAVIGIELDRDPACSAQYVTSITPNWLRAGRAVAIKDGHAIRGSHIFGRFSKGLPEVTACHWLICPKCGNRVLMPTEVWKWKDYARDELKVPQAVLDEMQGSEILAKWGSCSCSGKWEIDTRVCPAYCLRPLPSWYRRV